MKAALYLRPQSVFARDSLYLIGFIRDESPQGVKIEVVNVNSNSAKRTYFIPWHNVDGIEYAE